MTITAFPGHAISEGEGHSPSPSDPHRRGAPDGQQSLPILTRRNPEVR